MAMLYPPSLSRLIEALRCLPGVGPKSAQRMAFHLLERDRDGGRELAQAVTGAIDGLGHCRRCRMFTEGELCPICASHAARRSLLCVVESPADVVAVEQSASYRGCYFVLMGHLSPLDGIGPHEIGIERARRAAWRGRGRRSDPRHQSDGRGRGHGALPRRGRRAARARARRESRTACRSAASSSTSMAARSRTRSPAASAFVSRQADSNEGS